MAEGEVDLGLGDVREVGALWEYLPELDVVLLDLPLLAGLPWLAVV